MTKTGLAPTEDKNSAAALLEELWQIENREVLQMLDAGRGGVAVQIAGPLGRVDLASALPKADAVQLVAVGEISSLSSPGVVADLSLLPVKSASVETLVLLHTLERLAKPLALIDEIDRVLVEDGELIVAGFNPYSLFGLFSRKSEYGVTPYRHSPGKIRQWLELTDLQVERLVSNYFRPPIASSRWRGRTELLDRLGLRLLPGGGALYVMRARKRTYRITPVGIDFSVARRLPVPAMPSTAREGMGRSALKGNAD